MEADFPFSENHFLSFIPLFHLGKTVNESSGNQILKQKFISATGNEVFLFTTFFLLMEAVIMFRGTQKENIFPDTMNLFQKELFILASGN